MRFKAFKNFSLGRLIKDKKDKPEAEDSPTPEIAEIEEKIPEKTGDVEQTGENSPELSDKSGIIVEADDTSVRPHGPAAELTLEPEEVEDDADIKLDEVESDDSTQLGEEVKISEVSAEKAAAQKEATTEAAAPTEEKPEEKTEAKTEESDSLNGLFSSEEEEENPLASLINSLPDVSVQELMDDLEEIQRIIKEWKPSSK